MFTVYKTVRTCVNKLFWDQLCGKNHLVHNIMFSHRQKAITKKAYISNHMYIHYKV